MKTLFKYDIGDSVRLLEDPGRDNTCYGEDAERYEDIKNRTYRVIGWGWSFDQKSDATVPKIFYRLEFNGDQQFLSWKNEIPENLLEPADDSSHPHEEDAVLYSTDGCALSVGMKVYADVYRKWYQKPLECNLNFVFACYGNVHSLYFYKGEDTNYQKVKIEREFLCTSDDGKPRGDACRKGYVMDYNAYETTVQILDDYPEQYVNEVVNSDIHYDVLEPDCVLWRYEVDQWLHHIGVYNRVMEIYAAKKAAGELPHMKEIEEKSQKKIREKHKKLQAIIDNLSPEEREELKEIL